MSNSAPQQQAPRIAIKFGTSSAPKPSSNATNRSGQSQLSTLGKRQRPNALYHDSDSGGEDDRIGRHEAVTTIGTDVTTRGGDGPSERRHKKEYVISSQKNRDWKADAKERRGDRPASMYPTSTGTKQSRETAPADEDKDIKWGLNVTKKSLQEAQVDSSQTANELQEPENNPSDETKATPEPSVDVDKDAMDALLGKRKPTRDFVIKESSSNNKPQLSEQDAYQRSMTEAADVSTIEEYDEIPEGEFGAAMLRGMGWKGEEFGSKPKEVKRRPPLMGLGSKEDEEIKKAELAKRHGHREPRKRLDEYRRDKEKEKQERNGRYRDSYKADRERERREHNHEGSHRTRYRDRDDRSYR
ncbi:DExH-box splicing factor binding site-domain-containing protein [Xylaria arbuscula]|nr:DExH-box splicing factor binding site-domain-containing protein [Xylaria arbuscula]